ncbi:GNAT family N-acetyltransferase [Cellulomonas triticagri]|uniref:GNAT family N-acetyltransferase n=1 Tax=Cellulomonas triticagri TaxID=2483352 RepID=A0A3M2JGG8_9CELL|nr:GNAT family N-acetyltransferase [Cellulomonas triticagri]RMI09368.1 GNAT family N-acetyltransferase [Cellulomonas triticagri]
MDTARTPGSPYVRLLPLAAVTTADAVAWQRLADQAAEPNMYLDPRFLLPARDRGHEAADLRLLVVQEGGEWLGALAVTVKRVAPRLPLHATTTGGGFMTSHADRHHPLLRAGRTAEALDALLRGTRAAGLPGLVQLQHLPDGGAVATALTEVAGAVGGARVHERRRSTGAYATRADLDVPPLPTGPGPLVDPPLATAHLRTDEARNVRRTARGLAKVTGGPLELHDRSADPGVDDEFLDLQAAGWKGDRARGGAALRLDPVAERWFRRVTAGFRHDGDLLALRLAAGGQTLWIGYALRSGSGYFGFLDAYAQEHGRYSPGSLGRLATMTYLFGTTDAAFFDPAFDARYTVGARLFPVAREHVDLLVAGSGPLAATVLRSLPAARTVAHAARRTVHREPSAG